MSWIGDWWKKRFGEDRKAIVDGETPEEGVAPIERGTSKRKALILDFDHTILRTWSYPDGEPQLVHEEIPEFLAKQHAEGVQLFIVSSSPRKRMEEGLRRVGIDSKMFTETVCLRETNEREFYRFAERHQIRLGVSIDNLYVRDMNSTRTEYILKAMALDTLIKKHGINKRNALYVGDLPHIDARAARVVGIPHENATGRMYRPLDVAEEWGRAAEGKAAKSKRQSRKRQFPKAGRMWKVKRNWTKRQAVQRFVNRKPR